MNVLNHVLFLDTNAAVGASSPQAASPSFNSAVVAPTVVAALLLLALVAAVAVAAVVILVMRRKHNAYRRHFDDMAYGYVKAGNEDL